MVIKCFQNVIKLYLILPVTSVCYSICFNLYVSLVSVSPSSLAINLFCLCLLYEQFYFGIFFNSYNFYVIIFISLIFKVNLNNKVNLYILIYRYIFFGHQEMIKQNVKLTFGPKICLKDRKMLFIFFIGNILNVCQVILRATTVMDHQKEASILFR